MKKIIAAFICAAVFILNSCLSTSTGGVHISRNLTDRGIMSKDSLVSFFMANNPEADKSEVKKLASLYIKEAKTEGINSDCAFVQMCHETGFLRYGNLVTPDMHNYCGLGAIDAEHTGERFDTMKEGVRAHIQHLHAYATEENVSLKNKCIDKRYKWVKPRGKAPDISGLTKTWAADPEYSVKLDAMLTRLEAF
ncbi:glucosaminidase domain-containing protein [Treponema sp.]|uniref:glucosaminidase domain-containing protein n=1 Tax=Treponema sp. TaxID=166 RepID=UPI0025FFD16E|nr:glucosaminidase domain-containing protein [Treponema sp.]MCR5219044.1 glucosaminidase domain-containing protein [Treponema sp.]